MRLEKLFFLAKILAEYWIVFGTNGNIQLPRERKKLINISTKERVQCLYPVGCRVKLLEMDDPFPPPIGMLGTVYGHDDLASVLVHWDNGSSLSVVYGVDRINRVE